MAIAGGAILLGFVAWFVIGFFSHYFDPVEREIRELEKQVRDRNNKRSRSEHRDRLRQRLRGPVSPPPPPKKP